MSTTKGIRAPDTPEVQADLQAKIRRAAMLIACYVDAVNHLSMLDAEREAKIKKINDHYHPRFDQLTYTRDDLAQQLWKLVPELIEKLGHGKRSVFLSTGKVSLKKSPDKLIVTDEKRALERISDLGLVRRFVRIKREIKKGPLHELLKADKGPNSMAGIEIVAGEDRLYINDDIQINRVTTTADAAGSDPGADSE